MTGTAVLRQRFPRTYSGASVPARALDSVGHLAWFVLTAVGQIAHALVENALIHGAVPGAPGHVAITVGRSGGDLEIKVRDNGPGVAAQPREVGRPGIGLANTRARLAHLYGQAASVVLENGAGGGAIARITLPFHELP